MFKCLDLFCCAGGAAMGLHRAGFEVTGVDVNQQPRYPFEFILGDALAQDLSGYDFVWASPPCQAYCALNTMPNRREHEKLIPAVRALLKEWGGPWIIENVAGARRELIDPVMLCGSMFDLESNGYQVRRHRYFESNVKLNVPMGCNHGALTMGIYGAKVRDIAKEKRHYSKPKETRGKPYGVVLPQSWGFEAMGVDWMNIKEASECIPPAFSEFLGRQVISHLKA
ncbi:MAG: DNA cytosine methyltransferase [Proteobacteria bacterium]|nr:DNA cytosine methyltransferase [Pseudomonadota bacterium]